MKINTVMTCPKPDIENLIPESGWLGVLGIDASLSSTGLAVAGKRGVHSVKSDAKEMMNGRLAHIHDAVVDKLRDEMGRVLVMIEDLPTNAIGAGKTGMARGAALVATAYDNAEHLLVVDIVPATLKKAFTGDGKATKKDMRAAFLEKVGHAEEEFKGRRLDGDMVDAWALAWLGVHLAYGADSDFEPGGRFHASPVLAVKRAEVQEWIKGVE